MLDVFAGHQEDPYKPFSNGGTPLIVALGRDSIEYNLSNAAMNEAVWPVSVECYAGYRGEETPRRFRFGEETVEVADVLDQWLAPDHRYFKVRTATGDVFILRHDVTSAEWEVTMFARGSEH